MKPFFIASLPRSRTAWLAALLTTDRSHCYHEALAHCSKASELDAMFRDIPIGTNYVGDADPAIGLFAEPVYNLFPNSHFIFIHRPIEEVIRSEYLAAQADGGEEFKEVSQESLRPAIEHALHGINRLWAALPIERKTYVRFADLDRKDVIRKIWGICLPGIPFQEKRYELLDTLRVTQMFSKLLNKCPKIHESILESTTANA